VPTCVATAKKAKINLPENPPLSPLVAKKETKTDLSDITHKITIKFPQIFGR
jgi:hypothetical protein